LGCGGKDAVFCHLFTDTSIHQLDGIALLTCITKPDLPTQPPPTTVNLYSRGNLLANLVVLGEGDATDGDVIDGDVTDGDSSDLPSREKFLAVPVCRSYIRPSDALRTCFGVSRRDSKFSVFPISCGS
jgi:hypothetical protein